MSLGKRKQRVGTVVKHAMAKTCIVEVERAFRHPQYRKTMRRTSRFHVHDATDQTKAGDRVRIEETRPLSKLKRWRLVEVLERNPEA